VSVPPKPDSRTLTAGQESPDQKLTETTLSRRQSNINIPNGILTITAKSPLIWQARKLNMKKTISILCLLYLCAGCSTPQQPHKVSPQFSGGIGALLRNNNGRIEVVAIAKGLPADIAGIKTEDRILEIDGIPTLGLDINETTLLIRGEADTQTTLLIQSPTDKAPRSVTITRQILNPETVTWKDIEVKSSR